MTAAVENTPELILREITLCCSRWSFGNILF